MATKPTKPFNEVVAELALYPEEAFHFVRDGLNFTIERIHGPTTPEQIAFFELLKKKNVELSDLIEASETGQLDAQLAAAFEAAGGIEQFNRHVNGQDLCWGLRDYALDKWGLMARFVLKRWGIVRTADFGRIVFAMVENGFMQKQPHDSLDDFNDVFDFSEAFDAAFQPGHGMASDP